MHGHFGGIWDRTVDREGPNIILGEPLHCGMNGALLRCPVQGPPGGHPGRYTIPQHLQHGGGISD